MPRTSTSSQWLDMLLGVGCVSVSTACSTGNLPTTPTRTTWWHESSTVGTYTAPSTGSELQGSGIGTPWLVCQPEKWRNRLRYQLSIGLAASGVGMVIAALIAEVRDVLIAICASTRSAHRPSRHTYGLFARQTFQWAKLGCAQTVRCSRCQRSGSADERFARLLGSGSVLGGCYVAGGRPTFSRLAPGCVRREQMVAAYPPDEGIEDIWVEHVREHHGRRAHTERGTLEGASQFHRAHKDNDQHVPAQPKDDACGELLLQWPVLCRWADHV
jgi:hypothetical protein